MTQLSLLGRWDAFLEAFFQPPNELPAELPLLGPFVARGRAAVSGDPPAPLVMPAKIAGITTYFAIAFTPDQARTFQETLRSHVGTTWTDFDGRSLTSADSSPLDQAAVSLAGDRTRVFRFRVSPHRFARDQVRGAVEALSVSLAAAPAREARIAVPIGRLLSNFFDSCAAGAQQAAEKAYDVLFNDHRISAVNKLFLRIQLLAAFERWTDIEEHPQFIDLLRMRRPSLASDALSRVAMAKIGERVSPGDAGEVATTFGALITSVSAIRSVHSARYYALWALRAGEPAAAVRGRLEEAGWLPDPVIDRWTEGAPLPPSTVQNHATLESARDTILECFATGRYDTAVDLFVEMTLTEADLPAVVEAVINTWTPNAVALLERCRREYGEEALRRAVLRTQLPPTEELGLSMTGHFAAVFDRGSASSRARHLAAIAEGGVAALAAVGGAAAIADVIRQTTGLPDDEVEPEAGLDACLDLARDLKASGCAHADLRVLGLAVVELWALRDRSGDRYRAQRVVQLVNDVIELGLSVEAFNELVEWLRVGWEPFCTEADLARGLELLELLLTYQPADARGLDVFGRQVLARLGPHNAQRVAPAALAVAVSLAPTFDMQVSLPPSVTAAPALIAVPRPATVALYSLLEPMLERSAAVLRERHPELVITTCHDLVATEALRSAAKAADLVVIMDRAATHAATNALRSIKDATSIRYAAGKGSTSMVEAVESWLAERNEEATSSGH